MVVAAQQRRHPAPRSKEQLLHACRLDSKYLRDLDVGRAMRVGEPEEGALAGPQLSHRAPHVGEAVRIRERARVCGQRGKLHAVGLHGPILPPAVPDQVRRDPIQVVAPVRVALEALAGPEQPVFTPPARDRRPADDLR